MKITFQQAAEVYRDLKLGFVTQRKNSKDGCHNDAMFTAVLCILNEFKVELRIEPSEEVR